MNNNNNFPFFWFIFFMFMFGGILDLLLGLLPVILLGIGAYSIFKAIKKKNQEKQNEQTKKYTDDTYKDMSNHQKSIIDNRLKKYFTTHLSLPIFEDIALVPRGGEYSSVEDLCLSYNDEVILTLAEFKEYDAALYNSIVSLLLSFAKQKEEVIGAEIKVPEVKEEAKLSDAQKYIDKINLLNINLPNEEIHNGLYQTCTLLKQIDLAKKENKESKLVKLYDYYLPILITILENYSNLAKANASSKEFKDSETELIKTIILINEALKSLNESLREEDYMNLSADITTLQSLLKKDGLVSEPFKEKGDNND